jgi:hypothetical protein
MVNEFHLVVTGVGFWLEVPKPIENRMEREKTIVLDACERKNVRNQGIPLCSRQSSLSCAGKRRW